MKQPPLVQPPLVQPPLVVCALSAVAVAGACGTSASVYTTRVQMPSGPEVTVRAKKSFQIELLSLR